MSGAFMRNRLNENFLDCYLAVDKACSDKFGVGSGGVTEYINRLNNARFAPSRDEVLPRLVKYRNIRNKFAHEVGSMRKCDDLAKEDVKWLRKFSKDLTKRRDPLSVYLRRARRYARRRRARKAIFFAMLILLIIAAVVLYFVLR